MANLSNAELLAKVNQLQEKLYDNGIEERPSIMTEIKEIEAEAAKKLETEEKAFILIEEKYAKRYNDAREARIKAYDEKMTKIKKECEKQTGRNYYINKKTWETHVTPFGTFTS